MPIKSYIVFPAKGKKDLLRRQLASMAGCEVIPALNKDVLILVTETFGKQEEDTLMASLEKIKEIEHLSLVSGYSDHAIHDHHNK